MNEKRWTYLALLSALMLAIYVTTGNHVTTSRTTQQNHTAQKSLADQLKSGNLAPQQAKNPPQAGQVKAPTSLDVGGARGPAVGDESDHLKVQSNQVPVDVPSNVVPVASQSVSNSNYALGNTNLKRTQTLRRKGKNI